jgi:alpha-ketoglutarate-dependent taurine dioxygenase
MTTPATHARSDIPAGRYDTGDLRHPKSAARLRQQLATDGLALFHGPATAAGLLTAAATIMTVLPHPDAGRDGITTITDRGAAGDHPGAAGFSRRELLPHTDRCGTRMPPALLMTACAQPASTGGASRLTDGQAVHDDLAVSNPEALRALTRPRSVLFGGTAGEHLSAVLTDIPSRPPRRLFRLRLDDLATFAPDLIDHLPALRAAITRHTVTTNLRSGHGYLLDNHRWLHARDEFTGTRTLYRILGNPLPSLRLHTGIQTAP